MRGGRREGRDGVVLGKQYAEAQGIRLDGVPGLDKVWDASSGKCLWTGHVLPERQTAAIDSAGRFLSASPEAWRWLGWRSRDPDTGELRILPVETYGPLPVA